MHIESIPTANTHCSGGPYQQGGFQALVATMCNLHDVLEVLLHISTTPTHLHTQRQTLHPHKTPKAFVSPEENLVYLFFLLVILNSVGSVILLAQYLG
jgi:hypothetical protein